LAAEGKTTQGPSCRFSGSVVFGGMKEKNESLANLDSDWIHKTGPARHQDVSKQKLAITSARGRRWGSTRWSCRPALAAGCNWGKGPRDRAVITSTLTRWCYCKLDRSSRRSADFFIDNRFRIPTNLESPNQSSTFVSANPWPMESAQIRRSCGHKRKDETTTRGSGLLFPVLMGDPMGRMETR